MTFERAAQVLSYSAEWNGSGQATSDELREAKRIACDVLCGGAIEWIRAERPPENPCKTNRELKNYLIYMPEYGVDIGNFLKEANIWVCMGIPAKVTHWAELPAAPISDDK